VETTGNAFLNLAAEVSAQVRGPGAGQHVYYGRHHARCESGHHMGTPDVEQYLDTIELTAEERARCCSVVDRIYALYTAFTDEMYRYAVRHSLGELREGRGYGERLVEPYGAEAMAAMAAMAAPACELAARDDTGAGAGAAGLARARAAE
jgi:hypothetical protein